VRMQTLQNMYCFVPALTSFGRLKNSFAKCFSDSAICIYISMPVNLLNGWSRPEGEVAVVTAVMNVFFSVAAGGNFVLLSRCKRECWNVCYRDRGVLAPLQHYLMSVQFASHVDGAAFNISILGCGRRSISSDKTLNGSSEFARQKAAGELLLYTKKEAATFAANIGSPKNWRHQGRRGFTKSKHCFKDRFIRRVSKSCVCSNVSDKKQNDTC
jgi:hypothetical protein